MSWNASGWIQGAQIKDDTPPCACGHRADSHLSHSSCSARGRWWRRCRCSYYIPLYSATPQAPMPSSPHYDLSMASQPAQPKPVSDRQDEQPPHEQSPGESWRRRIRRKAADTTAVTIEILAYLLS